MSGKVRIDRRAEETRQRIGAAFLRLGGMHGLAGIRIDRLASEAGISRSTFYAHYAGLGSYLALGFADMLVGLASRDKGARLLPVAAILEHVDEAGPAARELAHSKHFPHMLVEGERALQRLVEERMKARVSRQDAADRQVCAQLLAAGFLSLLRDRMADPRGRTLTQLDERVLRMERVILAS